MVRTPSSPNLSIPSSMSCMMRMASIMSRKDSPRELSTIRWAGIPDSHYDGVGNFSGKKQCPDIGHHAWVPIVTTFFDKARRKIWESSISKETRALLITPSQFDNTPQEYYNTAMLTDVLHKGITKKTRHPTLQRVPRKAFWGKGNVPIGVIYRRPRSLSNRENGFLLLIEKRSMPRQNSELFSG